MKDLSEQSEKEWNRLVEELANYYPEINKKHARELLQSSTFGDSYDSVQVNMLIQDAKHEKAVENHETS